MPHDGNSMNPNPVNPYYAATEKAVAARRPFQTRKKPAKRTAGVQASAGSVQAFLIGQWMSAGRSQALTEDRQHAPRSAKGPDLG
jgi:hypothetical protein